MNKTNTNRKKTRRLLFQQLFSSTFQILDENSFLESFYNYRFSYEIDKDYLEEMKKIIFYREWFFIDIVKKYSPKFDFEKMNILNILPVYIALAEIFYFSLEIPLKVSINEAVEIAKVFSGDSWKRIVNWILNSVVRDYDELLKEKEKEKDNYNWNDWYSIFKK